MMYFTSHQHTPNAPALAGSVLVRATRKVTDILGTFTRSMQFLSQLIFVFVLLCMTTTYAESATSPSTLITNSATVSYGFLRSEFEETTQVSFITARDQATGGTPSVITLMQNSVDFSSALRASQSQANSSTLNARSSFTQHLPSSSQLTRSRTVTADGPTVVDTNLLVEGNQPLLIGDFPIQQGACSTSASKDHFVAQPAPINYAGQTLSLPTTMNLRSDAYFKVGDAIFIHLEDLDQNLDPTTAEDIIVTLASENGLDQETVRLHETGASTGTFSGYIQSVNIDTQGVAPFDCKLSVRNDSLMQAQYVDRYDAVDFTASAGLFDPSSVIFNSNTGNAINGIQVTLIDTATGSPATVLGDDGVSAYPNPVISGEDVTDSSGRAYVIPDGGFRFPTVGNIEYEIQLSDSPYYDYPSVRSDEALSSLPTAPYLLGDASRGLPFTVNGSAFQFDIPLDPKDNQVLLTKTANKTQAGIADVLRYSIHIQNSEVPGDMLEIHDKLPAGFRFEKGSATLDGAPLADPLIQNDGRSLSFTINQIAPEQARTLRYVARVGVNTPLGTATNTAWLVDDILQSNTAEAHVEIKEELFSNATRLFGRVYVGHCADEDSQDINKTEKQTLSEGIAGVRIYLENGTYVVTDEDGMWHIEGQQPGTHVVQLDTDSLPKYLDLVSCDHQAFHAGRQYSQFVDVQPGGIWRADFVVKLKPPAEGTVTQRLSSQIIPINKSDTKHSSVINQKIRYRLDMSGTDVTLKNLRALVMLPDGVRYAPKSARFDNAPIAEPKFYDEQTLLFSLNNPGKDWQHQLEFDGFIDPNAKAGELITRSVAMFDAPAQVNQRTPVAMTSALLYLVPHDLNVHAPDKAPLFGSFNKNLTPQDQYELDQVVEKLKGIKNLHIEVAGHTDNVPIANRSHHITKNNQNLSLERASRTANYLMKKLKLWPHQVSVMGYGDKKPLADNRTAEGRALNRRVEINIIKGDSTIELINSESEFQLVSTKGVAPGGFDWPVEATASGIDNPTSQKPPEFDAAWIAKQADNTFEWLWPTGSFLPNIPSTKVALKHPINQQVQLTLNGHPVSELNLAGREVHRATQAAATIWAGIDLVEGNNHFIAALINENNEVEATREFNLHYAGTPTKAVVLQEKSQAIADGVDAPVIAIRLTDKDGYPVRSGLQGEFEVSAPYLALDPNKKHTQITRGSFKPNYEVTENGIAYITLEPTTQAGEAVIRFPFANGQTDEVRVWLKPQTRDWMLVALGEGMIGYQNISGHTSNAKSAGHEKDIWSDGRVALFAKGQIKGEWLVTAAYDSAKGKTTPFENLIDPTKYYTLYGDNSQQKQDASMEGKLYVRIEKERFYSVFGDFNSDLNKTELSRYVRKFHGIQTVYQGDLLSFNLFATESSQRFVKDEILGDGTSGLYRLSAQDVIANSESITLQVRDRFRSEQTLNETKLFKDSDYVIDYIDGTLFFKRPIHSSDENFNPQYIVVDYETATSSQDNLTVGGRIAVEAIDDRVVVGTTVIEEDLGTLNRTLRGGDITLTVSDQLEIKAEAAQSKQTSNSDDFTSDAGLISLDYRSEKLQTKAYVRVQEAGFGLDQLNKSESGTEKVGVDSKWYFTPQRYVTALVSDQNTLNSPAKQQLTEIKYAQEYSLGRFHFGGRTASTTATTGTESETQQILAGHTFSLAQGDWLINTEGEFNLKRDQHQYDVLRLGSDYRLTDKVTLYGAHETSWDQHAPMRSTVGVRTNPWQGAQLNNAVEEYQSNDGVRLFAVHGLNQEININDHWQASFGFDQAQDLENTILENANTSSTSNDIQQNLTSQEDFYAANMGWGYRSQSWQWTNRVEYRESQVSHKWNTLTGLYHPVRNGLAMGLSAEYRIEDSELKLTKYHQLQFDIGLRPLNNGLAWLNQTKHIFDEDSSHSETNNHSTLMSRRIVNNTHINKRWANTQLSAQYGVKYVIDHIDQQQYNGFVDLLGTEIRHHINDRWDWGLHGRRLHDYELNDDLYSTGASLGYVPQSNTWVSLGYNLNGFVDTDFSAAGYTAQGIYLKIRVKADQDSLSQMRQYFF